MVGFHDVRFPPGIAYGSKSGFGFRTDVVRNPDSGAVFARSRRSAPQHFFEVGNELKSPEKFHELKEFYIARRGAAYGFRYFDWLDHATTPDGRWNYSGGITSTDVEIGVGDGVTTEFDLVKKYDSGGITVERVIRCPIHGETMTGPLADLGTVNVLANVGGSDTTAFTISSYPGKITFNSAPANGDLVKVGFLFDTPVHFSEEADERYSAEMAGFDADTFDGIELVELLDHSVHYESVFQGGAKDWGAITADVSPSLLQGKVNRFSQTTGSLNIDLPDSSTLPLGAEFVIVNDGTTTLTIRDHLGTILGYVLSTRRAACYLGLVGVTRTWFIR